MIFRLETEAYEEERLAAMTNRAPTTNEQEVEPTSTTIDEAQHDGPTPVDTHTTTDQQPMPTTLPEPVRTKDTQRKAAANPDSAEKPPSPTPSSEQPDQPHVPEDILSILEED